MTELAGLSGLITIGERRPKHTTKVSNVILGIIGFLRAWLNSNIGKSQFFIVKTPQII